MGSVSTPTFHSGTPKKVSATYTLGAGESVLWPGCFLYDPKNVSGAPLEPDPSGAQIMWATYEWETNNKHILHVCFSYPATSEGTSPVSEAGAGKSSDKPKRGRETQE
jgi:hypothetical protein